MTGSVSHVLYCTIATAIFSIVSINFLFPCNRFLPLDRRTISVVGALLCYLTQTFLFQNKRFNLLKAIDFDVLILLSSIMIINHLIIHLKETKVVVKRIQNVIRADSSKGFWIVSIAAFTVSPFLTNDGVCLLFVEPIIHAFTPEPEEKSGNNTHTSTREDFENPEMDRKYHLESIDLFYCLLSLACSANIGSALTYTGNPQNMIVASDLIQDLPAWKFLAYMFAPTLLAWLITTNWIKFCLESSKLQVIKHYEDLAHHSVKLPEECDSNPLNSTYTAGGVKRPISIETQLHANEDNHSATIPQCNPFFICKHSDYISPIKSPSLDSLFKSPVMSPRKRRMKQGEHVILKVVHVVTSPVPYIILILLAAMITMIFVDVMPISALVCISAMIMVLTLVIGNYWRGQHTWGELNIKPKNHHRKSSSYSIIHPEERVEQQYSAISYEEKVERLNEFFEHLFQSIDYSLLLIFLGLFIIVANMESTGIPRFTWMAIVGENPFKSVKSIVNISLFVLLSSQFLGNVPVVQLAKPNVHSLDTHTKVIAWTLISFVSTIGGNLTLTGSAANIIVAEKAAKLDSPTQLDFFPHLRVCFVITLVSCGLGAALLYLIAYIDQTYLS